jgi:hypothetical protein
LTLPAYAVAPLICPHCGNSSEWEKDNPKKRGITYCYLDWRLVPVAGADPSQIYCDFEDSDFAGVEESDGVRSDRITSPEADLSHYHCNACSNSFYDARTREEGKAQ